MTDKSNRRGTEDLENQFEVIRDDISTLTRLLREAGEAKAGESRDAALAEATKLLERSRERLDAGRRTARDAAASVEDYITEKPVQSALIALGVGLVVGLISRR